MQKQMLEAVSEMIDIKDGDSAEEVKTKIDCAKTILDKIIEGMDLQSSAKNIVNPIPESRKKSKESEPEKPQGQYRIEVDDNRLITKIHGLPIDAMVELDGKKMTHEEAIGKSFKNGRIL